VPSDKQQNGQNGVAQQRRLAGFFYPAITSRLYKWGILNAPMDVGNNLRQSWLYKQVSPRTPSWQIEILFLFVSIRG